MDKVGYIGWHNENHGFSLEGLKEIYSGVRSEPSLQPLNCESLAYASAITSNEARSDIRFSTH